MTAMEVQQLSFDFLPLVHVPTKGRSITEGFEAFHKANPQVYRMLRDMALSEVRNGYRRGSMKMLYETLRFHSRADITSRDEYRLNNNYTALYSRMLMESDPRLEGFFELRKRRAR